MGTLINNGGTIIITCWSERDILYHINRSEFSEYSSNITGEIICDHMKNNTRFSNVKLKYFNAGLNLEDLLVDNGNIKALINIISRSHLEIETNQEIINRIKRRISELKDNQRVSVVISADLSE